MQTRTVSDSYAAVRPVFWANTLFLIAIMALYPLAGVLLFALVNGGDGQTFSLLHIDRSMLASLRMIQAAGQVLVLALPVFLLAALHTGRRNPFSRESLAFLGIGSRVNFGAAALAVSGIFLLQPFLHTLAGLQDLYLWPALGTAGAEVVRQRDLMDSFIRELAEVRTSSEFIPVFFVFSVTPAVCEELFFRGYIQQNYTRSMSSGSAVLLTGFVFAVFHLSPSNLLPLALLGWYIGYIYSKTGNLAIPFFAHLVNNLAALLLLPFAGGVNSIRSLEPELVFNFPWWWLVVSGSLFLFVMVIRRFAALCSAERGCMTEKC